MDVMFFWISFVLYFLSTVCHVAYMALNRERLSSAATLFITSGLVFQTVALVLRSIASGHLPLTNMFEYFTVLAWFAALTYLISAVKINSRVLEAIAGPVIFMLYVSASLFPKEASQQLMPALQSYWLQIHVTLAAAGEAVFLFAFAASVLYLLKTGRFSEAGWIRRFPEPARLDELTYRFVMVGYPLFTIGALFAGAVWAYRAWGTFWSWDPKETCSLIVWLIYSFYLHARLIKGWRGKKTAWLAIAGFLSTLLTFFSNMILGGLHAYN